MEEESENKNKGKGNGAGLVWESQSQCFAGKFVITHSFGTDTQHDKEIAEQCCQLWLSLNNE